MAILINNKILQATELQVEKGLTPETRADYDKIVVAGMAAALEKGPESLMASVQRSKDPVASCAQGAVSLVMILRQHSQGQMPERAMVPAAMTLMLQALDFLDKSKIKKIDAKDLARATRIFTNAMFTAAKVTPDMLRNAAVKVHGITKDPTQMEMLARRAGVVKDPRASTPTFAPEVQKGARNGV